MGKEIWNRLVSRTVEIVVMDGNTIENTCVMMARRNGLDGRQEARLIKEVRKCLPDFE